ncbi:hypothetical protein ACIBG8_20745 [Nonomuraea sp. NPDC050556]|uniref:hypothetical protein n=1 Tax=Nonomuraea sp. NPDC050556 TaxID=3364369 RepID=UPI003795A1D8
MNSFEAVDGQLRQARERVRRFDQITAQRQAVAVQIDEVTAAVKQLEKQLAKEERDVARLEGGFAGFVARIAGSKEDKLARERAEVEAAWQRLHGQRQRLGDLTAARTDNDRELAELAGAQETYARVLVEKERLLVEQGHPDGRELVALSLRLADTHSDLREHGEAAEAGFAARKALDQVLRSLGSASSASTWDVIGGGFIADSIERDHLLRADQAAWHAQQALDAFARELGDIGVSASPKLPKVDTRWFVDTFFDNIITDALKHQRINRTREAVAEMARWVGGALESIATRRDQLTARRNELLVRREQLIAG